MEAMSNTREHSKITYYLYCKEVGSPIKATITIPYRIRTNNSLTLKDFKKITNRYGYRYFFTVYHKNFGPVKEEFVSDEDFLPMVGQRIESWLIDRDSSVTSSLVELYKYSSSSPCRRHRKQKYQLIQGMESTKSNDHLTCADSTSKSYDYNEDLVYGYRSPYSPQSGENSYVLDSTNTAAFGPGSLQSRLEFRNFVDPYYDVNKLRNQSPISQQSQLSGEHSRILRMPSEKSRLIHPEAKCKSSRENCVSKSKVIKGKVSKKLLIIDEKAENNHPNPQKGKKGGNFSQISPVTFCDLSPKGDLKSSSLVRGDSPKEENDAELGKQNKNTSKKCITRRQLRFSNDTERATPRSRESDYKQGRCSEEQTMDDAACNGHEEILKSHMLYEELMQYPQVTISKSEIYPTYDSSDVVGVCYLEDGHGPSYMRNSLSDSCRSLCNFPMRDCTACETLIYPNTTEQDKSEKPGTPFLKHENHTGQNRITKEIMSRKEIKGRKSRRRNSSTDLKSILKPKNKAQSTSSMCDLFLKTPRVENGRVSGRNHDWFSFQMLNPGKRTASEPSIKRSAAYDNNSPKNVAFQLKDLSRYKTRDISLLPEPRCSSCSIWQIDSEIGLRDSEVSLCSFPLTDEIAGRAKFLETKL